LKAIERNKRTVLIEVYIEGQIRLVQAGIVTFGAIAAAASVSNEKNTVRGNAASEVLLGHLNALGSVENVKAGAVITTKK